MLTPAGKPGIYGEVHFHNKAIGIAPYQDGNIWLVGQYRFTLGFYSWEIPTGGGPEGETPEESALRELREETGLIAHKLEPILEMHLSNAVSDEWGIVYLATELEQGEAQPEETEDLRVKRVTLDEAYAEVEARRITDSLSVAAIYKLMLMRERGDL